MSAVLLYSDLATDGVFMVSLFLTGNYIWGSLSAFFITLQFAASFAGVLLYVSRVADAKATAAVLVFGFPLAPLVLDLCLVLEPLGVLARLPPNPVIDKLKIGLPTYRATRTLLEVTVEGLPQSLLMLYVYIRVEIFQAEAGGVAISVDLLLLSLTLSLVNLIKTWVSAIFTARRLNVTLWQYVKQQVRRRARCLRRSGEG